MRSRESPRTSSAPSGPSSCWGSISNPHEDPRAVRAFVERLGAPVFVTPKAKGMLPEDHPLFYGVCAGVAGDGVIMDLFGRADLIIGLGFEPVESDKLWHHTMKLVSVGPVSIAAGEYRPHAEAVGNVVHALEVLGARTFGPCAWTADELQRFRADLIGVLSPSSPLTGLSGYELTLRLRELLPRDTIFATDVGAIKSVTSQAWATLRAVDVFRVERPLGDELQPAGRDGRADSVSRIGPCCARSAMAASA